DESPVVREGRSEIQGRHEPAAGDPVVPHARSERGLSRANRREEHVRVGVQTAVGVAGRLVEAAQAAVDADEKLRGSDGAGRIRWKGVRVGEAGAEEVDAERLRRTGGRGRGGGGPRRGGAARE